MKDSEKSTIKEVGNISEQEARVVLLMRELPYQTIIVKMENGKVIHKERIESIKD